MTAVGRIEADEVDVRVQDEGTVVLLWPITNRAIGWLDEHLPDDRQRWGSATVVEARYVWDILYGLAEDGLVLARAR